MDYYILQQSVWFVEPDKPTGPNYVEVFRNIFAGKKVAEHAAKRSALSKKEIKAIVDSIDDDALKSRVEYALGRIEELHPKASIIIMKVVEGKCVIIYDYLIKAHVVKTIEEIERDYVK